MTTQSYLIPPSKDSLGDRLKGQEQVEAARKLDPKLPVMMRLDGKAFHTFTRGLKRPYDTRLSALMVGTAAHLVEHTHALVGYTQSDEITLCWLPTEAGEYMYDGKVQKLTSVVASMASVYFALKCRELIPEKADSFPVFDSRVWNVPTVRDVYLNYVWRQQDAVKNSISMAAQAHFSSKALHGVGSEAKKQMLRDVGSPWEDEPLFFKMGTFVERVSRMVELTPEQLAKIPEKHRPTGPVMRSGVEPLALGYLQDDPLEADRIFGTGLWQS